MKTLVKRKKIYSLISLFCIRFNVLILYLVKKNWLPLFRVSKMLDVQFNFLDHCPHLCHYPKATTEKNRT